MANILVLSDGYQVPTGFGQQATYFSDWMSKKGHKVYHIGMNQHMRQSVSETGVTLLPVGDTSFGETVIGKYIEEYKIDILWTLLDLRMVEFIAQGGIYYNGRDYPINLNKCIWIGYFPIDTEDLPIEKHLKIIEAMHIPVVVSSNSREMLERAGIYVSEIPHCVDTEIFKPLDENEKKKFISKQKADLSKLFVVGMVGNNQLRKFNPYFFEAYSYFMKEDTRILPHMVFYKDSALAEAGGWNLIPIMHKILKIPPEHVISSGNIDEFSNKIKITPKQMCYLYNMMSVHYSSGNEGWGIPMLEAAACGIPNISPRYTSAEQMIGPNQERGRFCKISNYWYNQINGHRWVIPDTKDLAKQFEYYYTHRDELKKAGERAREWALQYDVKRIMPIWERLIDDALNYRENVNYKLGKVGV